MPKQSWNYKMSALLLASIMMLSAGCGQWNAGEGPLRDDAQRGSITPNAVQTPGLTKEGRINDEQLTEIAEQVPGVEHANVVMSPSDVIVGIQVDDSGKRRMIEKQVFSALQWQYPEYNYHVTSNEMLNERIKALKNETSSAGYRAQSFAPQIDAIVRAIDRNETTPYTE